jgi:hypothetical protein
VTAPTPTRAELECSMPGKRYAPNFLRGSFNMEDPDEIDAGSNLPVFEFGSATFEELQTGSPPDPLYHYTGQEGLLGIISTGQLRATKIQYMNDSTELGRAINLAHKEIKKHEIDPDKRELLKSLIEHTAVRLSKVSVPSTACFQT